MPAEIPTPAVAAAWIALNLCPTEDLPLWAAHWLAHGEDGEHLRRLAGLSRSEPREIHDVQQLALADCRAAVPESPVAAAKLAFDYVARTFVHGHLTEREVLAQVDRIVAGSGTAADAIRMPLGQTWLLDEEWDQGWGRTETQIKETIQAACQDQLAAQPAT